MIKTVTLIQDQIRYHNFPINQNSHNITEHPLSVRTGATSPIPFKEDLDFSKKFNISDIRHFSKKDMS